MFLELTTDNALFPHIFHYDVDAGILVDETERVHKALMDVQLNVMVSSNLEEMTARYQKAFEDLRYRIGCSDFKPHPFGTGTIKHPIR